MTVRFRSFLKVPVKERNLSVMFKFCKVKSLGIQSFKKAKARSPYNVVGHLLSVGINRKKREKQMHFIVRVGRSKFYIFLFTYLPTGSIGSILKCISAAQSPNSISFI